MFSGIIFMVVYKQRIGLIWRQELFKSKPKDVKEPKNNDSESRL